MHPDPAVTLDAVALDIACIEYPDLDPAPYLRELDEMALQIAERAGDLTDNLQFVRTANQYLFEEAGFHGNEANYYDPRNSCFNDVITWRTGIPITLSLVYLEIARRLAKPMIGIAAPGHFLVRIGEGGGALYIDSFHGGRTLLRDQIDAPDEALAPASNRLIAIRMLRNLEGAYVRAKKFDKALAVQDALRLADAAGRLGIRGRLGSN